MNKTITDTIPCHSKEESRNKSTFYHKKFPDIPSLSSSELVTLQLNHRNDNGESRGKEQHCPIDNSNDTRIILVDVRSKSERLISTIPDAVSLQSFEKEIVPSLLLLLPPTITKQIVVTKSSSSLPVVTEDDKIGTTTTSVDDGERIISSDDVKVIIYCTIGYRSGVEARRLKDKYSFLKGIIYNLDGIVPYTHAISSLSLPRSKCNGEGDEDLTGETLKKLALIDPRTKQVTDRVHVYGPTWNCVAGGFEAVSFSLPVMLLRSMLVGITVAWCKIQRYSRFRYQS